MFLIYRSCGALEYLGVAGTNPFVVGADFARLIIEDRLARKTKA